MHITLTLDRPMFGQDLFAISKSFGGTFVPQKRGTWMRDFKKAKAFWEAPKGAQAFLQREEKDGRTAIRLLLDEGDWGGVEFFLFAFEEWGVRVETINARGEDFTSVHEAKTSDRGIWIDHEAMRRWASQF